MLTAVKVGMKKSKEKLVTMNTVILYRLYTKKELTTLTMHKQFFRFFMVQHVT